ncbi:unnamed protein product [Adineta steineri]|uniref:Uncharacterized protein n=1 Tax=Adineta steineri TaxID=433720 RepID=A0A815NS95_9BILA|nr:unnamed protein product [Adineta steineri]CAF3906236.1 unnamed protein product [Adineta steineri]
MKVVALLAGCILTVTCVLYIVSNAVPSWAQISVGDNPISIGLWRQCESELNVITCGSLGCPSENDIPGFCGRILASRAFMTLTCILSGFTTISLFICAFTDVGKNRILLLITKALAFVCLIMGIIGVGVGGSIIEILGKVSGKPSLSAASTLGIIAIIINLVGAIVSLFIKQS